MHAHYLALRAGAQADPACGLRHGHLCWRRHRRRFPAPLHARV